MDSTRSTGKKIILGLASVAAAAGYLIEYFFITRLYYFFSRKLKRYPIYSRSQKEAAAKSFRLEKEGDLMLGETVVRFAFLVFEQAIPNYLNRIIKYREDRRKCLDNPKRYGKVYMEFREDMFKIKDSMEDEMLNILKIDKSIWEMSVVKERDNESLAEFYLNYPALIKSQFKSEKEIDRNQLAKILNDLHETIEKEESQILNDLDDPTLAQTLLENWAYDVIYEEYELEEEDIVAAMNEYYTFDPEIGALNKAFYQIIRRTVKKIKRANSS